MQILYGQQEFGPDKVENDKVDLLNKGDNISKNQHIVKLIEDIYRML